MNNILNTNFVKRLARKMCNVHNSCPVIVLEKSRSAPKKGGHSYYFTNKRGDIIRYPSAYAKAYGKPIYHHSTLHVTVGENWEPKIARSNDFKDVVIR